MGESQKSTSAKDSWIGRELPKVTLESSERKPVRLPDDLKGKWTILYFYPKDDTPGCTKQACSYRDHMDEFKKINAQVYGVSSDDLTSHDSFINKFKLNFPLLSDPERKLSGPLGVYGEQTWNGKTYEGLSRDTFLIDPEGIIRNVWRKVSPDQTMSETYQTVKSLI